jgi:hypothetical protein
LKLPAHSRLDLAVVPGSGPAGAPAPPDSPKSGGEFARDNYLNSALTVRGIAVMTMGFLDKTVGAGLTAVQQQADQNTVQQLLKQVAWSESKLANMDRARVYRDTDEKLEACLEGSLIKGAAQAALPPRRRESTSFIETATGGAGPCRKRRTRTGRKRR